MFAKNYVKKYVEKLIWPVRRDAGLDRNLGTTNHIESLDTSMTTKIGKRVDVPTSISRWLRMTADQEAGMFEAVLGRVPYKIQEDMKKSLLIKPQDMQNSAVLRRKTNLLVFWDTGKPEDLNIIHLQHVTAQVQLVRYSTVSCL